VSVAERAYTYAKSRGIIGKSFLEKRLGRLASVTGLQDLEELVFAGSGARGAEARAGGGIDALETRITKRSAKSILSVLGAFRETPEILVLLLRSYEYADLKRFIAEIDSGDSGGEGAPPWTPLGKFSTVNFSAFPDLNAMLRDSEFEFIARERENKYNKAASGIERHRNEPGDINVRLDNFYYQKLLAAMAKIPKNDFTGCRHLFFEEISLLNCTLAMRLRSYYGMGAKDVTARLITGRLARNGRSLSADAEASLSMELNHLSDWQDWRRRKFLNVPDSGKYWKCDPRRFQTAASIYLYKLALRYFRSRPFTLDTACCFIRLKQFEEQALTGVAEGTKLGMNAADTLRTLGVPL
jgi:vacuolar-type H+-ATPase subunit C/Vma6